MLAYNIIHEKVAGIPTLILAISSVWPHVLYKHSNMGKEVHLLKYDAFSIFPYFPHDKISLNPLF